MKSKLLLIFSVFILLITFYLLFKLHYSTKKEIIERFQTRQLITTHQLANELESCLSHGSQAVETLSSSSSLQYDNVNELTAGIQEYFEYFKQDCIKSVSVSDVNGMIIYSTIKNAISLTYKDKKLFEWAARKENKGKQFITPEVPLIFSQSGKNSTFKVLIAAPFYGRSTSSEAKNTNQQKEKSIVKFSGIVIVVLDLTNIITSFSQIDSLPHTKESSWILDKNGTVLYQPEHPEMLMFNLNRQDQTCLRCHNSFKYVETILTKSSGTTEYQLKDTPHKLSSFTSLNFKNISWKIVINIPLDEVSNFIDSNLIQTVVLFIVIIFTLIGSAFSISHSNRLKIRAEEKAKQWKEKHELEIKLRESENQYKSIVHNSPNAIFIHSEGKIVFVNPAALSLYGVTDSADILGKSIFDLVHPDDRETVKQRAKKMLESGHPVPVIEERFYKHDKSVIIAEAAPIPTTFQNKPAVQVIIMDITKRKRAELERQVMYEITNGVTTTSNLDELLKLIYQSLRKVFYAENCFVALYNQTTDLFSFPFYIDKYNQAPLPTALQKSVTSYVLKTNKPLLLTEDVLKWLITRNEIESQVPISPSWLGVPLQTPERVIGVLVLQHYQEKNIYTNRDVELLQSIGNQVAVVIERIQAEEEIKKRNEQLSKINAEKDKFFSIIAHDLRSPFNGLLGLSELMANGAEDFSKAELTEYSKNFHESTSNLYKLIENLLEWAQMQRGSFSFTPKSLNLLALTSLCIETIHQRALQKGITIVNEIPASINVNADEKMLNSVLRNLLSNAVKFTKRDGKIFLNAIATENKMIKISVTDNGIGISEKDTKRLFRMNEKVSSIGTDGEPSTVFGLLLCKEFVEKHSGEIWAESRQNVGSTFYFSLPRIESKDDN